MPGLALAGAWTETGWPDTMEGAVRSGQNAAEHIMTGLAALGPADQEHAPPVSAGRDRGKGVVMTTTMPAGVAAARDLVSPAIAGWLERLSPDVRDRRRLPPGLRRCRRRAHRATGRAARPCGPPWRCCRRGPPGAPAERGVAAAAAVEFVHNFSLLHDDIMDGDTERRHRPTAWTVFGVGSAILAGDALLCLAQDILLADPGPAGASGRPAACRRPCTG